MKVLPLLILTLIFSFSAFGQNPKAPAGWRFPTAKDMKSGWQENQKNLPMPYKVAADFNADRLTDEAWILIPKNGPGLGLFVFLRQKNNSFRSQLLDYTKGSTPQGMYVSIAEDASYVTACGKGYWKCAKGEPAKLDLKSKAFFYGVYESAASIFYWDSKTGRFRNVAISD